MIEASLSSWGTFWPPHFTEKFRESFTQEWASFAIYFCWYTNLTWCFATQQLWYDLHDLNGLWRVTKRVIERVCSIWLIASSLTYTYKPAESAPLDISILPPLLYSITMPVALVCLPWYFSLVLMLCLCALVNVLLSVALSFKCVMFLNVFWFTSVCCNWVVYGLFCCEVFGSTN